MRVCLTRPMWRARRRHHADVWMGPPGIRPASCSRRGKQPDSQMQRQGGGGRVARMHARDGRKPVRLSPCQLLRFACVVQVGVGAPLQPVPREGQQTPGCQLGAIHDGRASSPSLEYLDQSATVPIGRVEVSQCDQLGESRLEFMISMSSSPSCAGPSRAAGNRYALSSPIRRSTETG